MDAGANLVNPNTELHASTGSIYAIVENLAARGLPNTYLARVVATSSQDLPPTVVLETFGEDFLRQPYLDLFLTEGLWLPRQLRSAGFIRLYEAGKLLDPPQAGVANKLPPTAMPPMPYVALEPVEGTRLEALLDVGFEKKRRLPPGIAVGIALAVARALAYLHGLKTPDGKPLQAAYRGFSPGCVFILRDGMVRLLPIAGLGQTRPTATERPWTAFDYLAPELVQSQQQATPRSDLYALGAMMWNMMAGQPLFARKTDWETVKAVLTDNPPPLAQLGVETPPALEALMKSLLHKSPASRPAAAEEVIPILHDIDRQLGGGPSLSALAEAWLKDASSAKALRPNFACLAGGRNPA